MKIDLHTHTIASGHAFGTVQENAKQAAKKGIKLLGITDHGPALLGAPCETYFWCEGRVTREFEGVRILFGVEANIIDAKGRLDLSDKLLKKLDIVIAGFHENTDYTDLGIEKNTEVLINAIKNPYVKMLAHPYGYKAEVDIEKVTEAAIKSNILLEINASYFFKNKIADKEIWDKLKTMVRILKENGKKFIINSDAHNPFEIGRFEEVIEKFDELNITKDDLLNDNIEEVLAFLNIR